MSDILASISSNKVDAQSARDSLSTSTTNTLASLETSAVQLSNAVSTNQQSLETKLSSSIQSNQQQLSSALASNVLSLDTVQDSLSTTITGVETTLSAAISTATGSLDQQQSTNILSLETVQTQLSGAMVTVETGVSTTVSTEVAALEKLLAASSFNLSISLNDTVKISELEMALSGAIAANVLAIGDNGLADVSDRTLLKSVSTHVSTNVGSLSSAVVTANTANDGVNNLRPRLSTVEGAIANLAQVSRGVVTNAGSVDGITSRATSLSTAVSSNAAGMGLLTTRVTTLEDAKLSAGIATLSREASTATAALSTTQALLNKAIECQGKGQYLDTASTTCKAYPASRTSPAFRYVLAMRACWHRTKLTILQLPSHP